MRRPSFVVLVAIVAVVFLCDTAAPADLGLVNEVLEVLHTRHWNPNLDLPMLVRAGVGGLREELQRRGVDGGDLQEIPAGADRAQAVAAFGDRLDRAVQRAAGRVSERDLLYAGLRAMVNAAGDSHQGFFSQGVSASLGITLGKSDGQWIIGGVVPGGPADRGGVRPYDVLARVGDVVVATLTAGSIRSLLLGGEGTTVQVTLRRQSAERTLSIVRQRVVGPMVVSWMLPGHIGYLKLYGFFLPRGAANDDIRAAVARLLGAHPRALIVDLRENSGGDERVGLDTMSLFLPSGTKVAELLSRNEIIPWSTTGDPIVPAIPVTALIGPGTNSMGEVMAAALKERRGATLVGTRTGGNLEDGDFVRLSNGSLLEVAVAQVRTATGVEIEGRGYPADVEVSPAASGDQDLQLQRAIHVIMERMSP